MLLYKFVDKRMKIRKNRLNTIIRYELMKRASRAWKRSHGTFLHQEVPEYKRLQGILFKSI